MSLKYNYEEMFHNRNKKKYHLDKYKKDLSKIINEKNLEGMLKEDLIIEILYTNDTHAMQLFKDVIRAKYSSDVDYKNKLKEIVINDDRTPRLSLCVAASLDEPEVFEHLVKNYNLTPNKELKEEYRTPLHYAVIHSSPKMVQFIVEKYGFDPNKLDYFDANMLFYAARYNKPEMVEFFMDKYNFDPKAENDYRETILYCAAKSNNSEMIQFLVEKYKLDPKSKDYYGQTILHHAVKSNNPDVVDFIAEKYKLDPNEKNNEGLTPLHIAVEKDNTNMVKNLVTKHGADTKIENKKGKNAYSLALEYSKSEVAKLFNNKMGNIRRFVSSMLFPVTFSIFMMKSYLKPYSLILSPIIGVADYFINKKKGKSIILNHLLEYVAFTSLAGLCTMVGLSLGVGYITLAATLINVGIDFMDNYYECNIIESGSMRNTWVDKLKYEHTQQEISPGI